nr:tyrosine-protein kinase Fer-like [Biomphalaria glabrata]
MQDSSTDNISSRSTSTSSSGENDFERAVFKSQHSIEAKKLIEYNNSLKLNIEDLFVEHIDAAILLQVIKKQSKSVLTASEIDRIKHTYDVKGKLEAAKELLELLPKYENWFQTLLKCLKNRDLNLKFLIEHFKKINDDVHTKVYSEKNSTKDKPNSSSVNAKGKKRCLKNLLCIQKPEIPPTEDKMVTYLKTSLEHDDAKTSKTLETQTDEPLPDNCPCQVDFILKDLNSLLDPSRKKNPGHICNQLNLLLGLIKPYRYCFKMLETKVLKYDLSGLFSSVCKMNVFLQMNMSFGIQIKQTTSEIFVYFITSSNLICQKLLETDEFLDSIETEMDGLLIHLTLEDDSDEDLKAALVEIKRNMMHLLLAVIRHKTCEKKRFLRENWRKIIETLFSDDDHFVADMSLIVMSYIFEGLQMIKILAANDLSPEKAFEDLLLNLRSYAKYSIPSSKMKLEVFAYIEGLAQLATLEKFEDKILTADTIDALHSIVQRLQDQKIDRTYLSLSTKVKASKTKDIPCVSLNRETSIVTRCVDNDTDVKNVFKTSDYINFKSPTFESLSSSGDFASNWCAFGRGFDYALTSHNGCYDMAQDSTLADSGIDRETLFLQESTKSYTSNLSVQLSLDPDQSTKQEPCSKLQHLETDRQAIERKGIIGQGNFATVWKGVKDKTLEVAVKIIDSSISSPCSYMHEVNIMSRLKHPNIVQLLNVVTMSNPVFIVLEYMSKGDLKTFLQSSESKCLLYKDFAHMDLQVTEGMLYLEQMEIVHRDLRAQNVLVGENKEIKISDFGIALDLRKESKLYNDLSDSSFPIKWTSPEAAIKRKFSSKSDVWSFGAFMYEIITRGQDPYGDLPNDSILKMLKEGKSKILPRVKPSDIPKQYWNMMQKCCRQEPAKRPSFKTLNTFFTSILE